MIKIPVTYCYYCTDPRVCSSGATFSATRKCPCTLQRKDENTQFISIESNMTSSYVTFQFGLFPDRKLQISLHRNLKTNPHEITKRLASIGNDSQKRFAIMDAYRIVSLDHVAIASNIALMRNSAEEIVITRGVALDTVICAAGSTNVMSVMKEYAFDLHSDAAKNGTADVYAVLLIAFDCELDQNVFDMAEKLKLGNCESLEDTRSFFSRKRSEQEIAILMKAYKVTKEEMEMRNSSLESSILNRLATKYL